MLVKQVIWLFDLSKTDVRKDFPSEPERFRVVKVLWYCHSDIVSSGKGLSTLKFERGNLLHMQMQNMNYCCIT
jgi:hypothetical protein